MIFTELPLPGAFVIEPERRADERGFFARTWCRREFADHGIVCDWVQCNVSFNRRKGTLRGLHYQAAPWAEAKLVRCTAGAIYDVLVDLRRASPCFGKWTAVELTAAKGRMLYVPPGFAHGFQTLADNAEVFYQMSEYYRPEAARGCRWDDPALGIVWPDGDRVLSPRDQQFPDFAACDAF